MSGDWLTYAEAAQRLGIKSVSVKKPAIRRGWPRQAGNDGLARIRLPDDRPVPPTLDAYRDETLKRLEEEHAEFRAFLERLREAKDRAEFDQFMAQRRAAAGTAAPVTDGDGPVVMGQPGA